MNNLMLSAAKVSLFTLIITGTAIASDSLAPVGTLQTGTHTSIQNELGKFPVSGTYTIMAGDQIEIGESDAVATITLDIGTLYIRPESSLTLNESDGNYTVVLVSGSIGYELNRDGMLDIISSGKEITPIATDGARSGAVALGPEGKLIVIPVLGDARAVADDGMVTTVTQGYTWTDAEQGAQLTQTQVTTGGMTTDTKVLIGFGFIAGGILIYGLDDNDKKSKSPSS